MKKKEYNYNDSIAICEKALDMLDIKSFLESGKELKDVMETIEEYVNKYALTKQDAKKVYMFMLDYPDIFYDDPPEIFNYMTDDEFMNYCQKRFPEVHWQYECIERYWIS